MKRLLSLLVLICMLTLPALAATSSGCPSSALGSYQVASNVAATFSISGNTTTYTFTSLTNENPLKGVPGLMKYCVYPTSQPTTIVVLAKGADGSSWVYRTDPHDFAFVRPGGNKTDIPLNGKTTTMGTATWSGGAPSSQTILLHINDPAVCTDLYGIGSPGTCFVKPSLANSCVVGDGDTVAAYNAIPFGGVNCSPPSVGVEAYGFNELGDQVVIAGTARQLVTLNVLFTSYGCSVSGHWYSGDCVTNLGDTFNVPITANVYDSANCSGSPLVCSGAPLATVITTQTIPYRPSEDNVNCTGADAGKWFNPQNGPTGKCQYSIGKLLTFDFSNQNIALPTSGDVIWTVAYNTSHSGYNPIANPLGPGDACETSPGGCGYDSLNVGVMSYPNAPYAGTDVDESVVFINWWQGNGVPQYPPPFGFGVLTPPVGVESTTDAIISSWIGYRPLGEIITK